MGENEKRRSSGSIRKPTGRETGSCFEAFEKHWFPEGSGSSPEVNREAKQQCFFSRRAYLRRWLPLLMLLVNLRCRILDVWYQVVFQRYLVLGIWLATSIWYQVFGNTYWQAEALGPGSCGGDEIFSRNKLFQTPEANRKFTGSDFAVLGLIMPRGPNQRALKEAGIPLPVRARVPFVLLGTFYAPKPLSRTHTHTAFHIPYPSHPHTQHKEQIPKPFLPLPGILCLRFFYVVKKRKIT